MHENIDLATHVVQLRETGLFHVVMVNPDGQKMISDQGYASIEEASAALDAWCEQTGSTRHRKQ